MTRPTNSSWRRVACLATAIALLAMLGGCARSANESATGGTATSLVAPAPGAPDIAGTGTNGATIGQSTPGYAGAGAADAAKGGNAADSPGASAVPVDKLIVVNKTLRLEAKDVDGSLAKIRALASRDGADITNMQVSSATDGPVYPQPLDGATSSNAEMSSIPLKAFVTLRVPSAKYAAFIADAAKLGRVLYQSESSDDVTQQHVDMQARLGNLKAEQSRLRQLFSQARNVSDMLKIEKELTRVQGDIESLQAQMAYLERQASMATVTIELVEPVAIGSPAGVDWGVSTAFTDSVRAFVSTMNGLIVLLGPALALVVFVGLPVWLIVWLVRRSLRRRTASRKPAAGTDTNDTPGAAS